jgi:pimeloyl-ACP methyl ester carboxylesterase
VFDYGHMSNEERGGILDPMRTDLNAFITDLVANTLPENAPARLAEWLLQEMSVAKLSIAHPSFASLLDWDAAPTLAKLSAPVFAINGSLINPTASERYRGSVHELTIPDVGHFPQLEKPAIFKEQLETALRLSGLHS